MVTLKIGKGFGKRLRKLRKAAGLTQAALGEKAGVHPVSIAQYETGACNPSEKTAEKLRAYFDHEASRPPKMDNCKCALVPVPANKRGRPRKVKVDEEPKREKWGRSKKVAEVITQKVAIEADVPDKPKPTRRRTVVKEAARGCKAEGQEYIKTPARLGIVSKDWLDQQIEAHVHSRGMLFVDGPCRIVCMTKRDVAELCRIMLQVGGVQVNRE